jgi:hypothetical protein
MKVHSSQIAHFNGLLTHLSYPQARRDRESQAMKPKQPLLLHMNKNIHGIPTNGVLFELKISWWHHLVIKILLNCTLYKRGISQA